MGASAAGPLKGEAHVPEPFELPVSIFPGISGYATGELGIHSIILDEPTNDFFQLSNSVNVRMVLLAKDPGMEVWNFNGSAYMNVGQSFPIGTSPFDTHPLWNLVSGVPGNTYSLTIKMHDLNGVYADSDPIVLNFTAAPAPGPFAINVAAIAPQQVTLAWPTNAIGWELQSTFSLIETNWTTMTNAPVISGTNFSLSLMATNEQQYFRLFRP